MRNMLIATAGVLALSAGLAAAQDITDRELAAADANQDGSVSHDEFMGLLEGAWRALDADANDVVTWVEAEVAMAREHFDALDTNKDGNLSLQELQTQGSADFRTADQDGDGSLMAR